MEWDTVTIETRSIIKLKDCLTRNCRLYPLINENDKTPSWDGEVIVYNSSSRAKNNIYGTVPVQVKGSIKENLTKSKIKFSLSSSDFENYKDNGIIIFVVYMKDYDEYKIYYNALLPFDLHRLVKGIKDQKTKTIELKEFPKDNQKEVVNIFLNFVKNQKLQGGTIDDRILSLSDMSKLGIRPNKFYFDYKIDNPRDFKKMIENSSKQETYIYIKPDGFNIKIPVDKIDVIEEIIHEMPSPIEVDNKVFYENYKVITRVNEYIIIIGNSLELNMSTGKFHYDFCGTLSERIRDIKFFISLLNNEKIKIKEIELPNVIENSCSEDIQDIKKELNRLEIIKNVLVDILGVNEDLEMDELSKEDWSNLFILIKSIIYHETVSININNKQEYEVENLDNQKLVIGDLNIGNLNIKLIFVKCENNEYQIINFFSNHGIIMKVMNNKKEIVDISLYTKLKKEDFLMVSNVSYSNISESLIKMPKSETQNNLYNGLLLEMLKAYDEQEEKNIKLLNSAKEIITLLLEETKSDSLILKINKFQIIKRERKFGLDEIQELYKMKFTTENKMALIGIDILLDNFNEASFYYDKLSNEEKEEFNQYPIASLWNDNK
ncbi:hypothetical protein RBU49_02915 [Clostridium sp. MB40-C1]|uniref:hypothetical protein n=1 Tax=Clostridium sp. MB40-C1 TaxID=3070996 RepID=UPI0027E12CAD|nr:hypothetical protein [Clostridium sp. MB40-C1]WMJ81221.1 hypothetical protein RBU49_02915 [Clostridium sp. MB40-C1]